MGDVKITTEKHPDTFWTIEHTTGKAYRDGKEVAKVYTDGTSPDAEAEARVKLEDELAAQRQSKPEEGSRS